MGKILVVLAVILMGGLCACDKQLKAYVEVGEK